MLPISCLFMAGPKSNAARGCSFAYESGFNLCLCEARQQQKEREKRKKGSLRVFDLHINIILSGRPAVCLCFLSISISVPKQRPGCVRVCCVLVLQTVVAQAAQFTQQLLRSRNSWRASLGATHRCAPDLGR